MKEIDVTDIKFLIETVDLAETLVHADTDGDCGVALQITLSKKKLSDISAAILSTLKTIIHGE